ASSPWPVLPPLALFRGLGSSRGTPPADRAKFDVAVVLFGWALVAFALVTFMGTKFHHYIFPALPPIAMLIGITLDDLLPGDKAERDAAAASHDRHDRAMLGAAAIAGALVTLIVGRDLYLQH